MNLLILARHGNTFEDGEVPRYVGARSDLQLTAKGKEQAFCLAEELKFRGLSPESFFAGPLVRQIETATIVARQFGFEDGRVEVEPALAEIDLGPWEGLSKEQIKESWSVELQDWEENFVWPERVFAQSRTSRENSLRDFLARLAQRNAAGEANQEGKTVFIATSNGVLRMIHALFARDVEGQTSADRIKLAKVATGAFCLARMLHQSVAVKSVRAKELDLLEWNIRPSFPLVEGLMKYAG
jgi:broad specificity phosphatase PhoE